LLEVLRSLGRCPQLAQIRRHIVENQMCDVSVPAGETLKCEPWRKRAIKLLAPTLLKLTRFRSVQQPSGPKCRSFQVEPWVFERRFEFSPSLGTTPTMGEQLHQAVAMLNPLPATFLIAGEQRAVARRAKPKLHFLK
jgi:hypothetical protein